MYSLLLCCIEKRNGWVSVPSLVNNFVHPHTASDYGYHTFGELTRFNYCLLQKVKQGSSLPLVEQWDEYVLANHSKFPPIAGEEFLAKTRLLTALNKIGSSYLRKEFQLDARRFLEEFTNSVLSTVAARSKIGREQKCFCPAIIIGGDDHAPQQLLGLLLDGFLEREWIKCSEVEACRAKYQSFVQEQRQLERARQHLFKVCIVASMVKPCDRLSCK